MFWAKLHLIQHNKRKEREEGVVTETENGFPPFLLPWRQQWMVDDFLYSCEAWRAERDTLSVSEEGGGAR